GRGPEALVSPLRPARAPLRGGWLPLRPGSLEPQALVGPGRHRAETSPGIPAPYHAGRRRGCADAGREWLDPELLGAGGVAVRPRANSRAPPPGHAGVLQRPLAERAVLSEQDRLHRVGRPLLPRRRRLAPGDARRPGQGPSAIHAGRREGVRGEAPPVGEK